MNHVTAPALVDVPMSTSINTLLADRVRRTGNGTLMERRDSPNGAWIKVSANDFDEQVKAVGRGLIARGIQPGDRVAILSRTRYEWTLLDFALWAVGAVPVPIYETSSPEQMKHYLGETDTKMVFAETQKLADEVNTVRDDLPNLETILVIDKGAIKQLRAEGVDVPVEEVKARSEAVTGNDLASIIYTSGSTGVAKGVEITHHAFCHIAENCTEMVPEVLDAPGSRTLLFLPLAHVLARAIEIACVASNSVMGHAPDVKNLVDDLGSFKPTFLLAVPRVFEKVYNSAQQKAAASKVKQTLFNWATRSSIAASRAKDTGDTSIGLDVAHKVSDALVLKKLREAMGGRVKYAISGGAPLGERLGHFYRGLGLTVLEGYGLTETSAPTTLNTPQNVGIGTVGGPIAGSSIKIADDGEILVKGPHLFRGYFKQPELTAEVMEDGWFHTGDIGSLDEKGRLRITGRKKELIVTAGGKNVAPTFLEDRLRSHPLVSQVVVVGDQRPYVAALLTLDTEMMPKWLETHGLPPMTVEEAKNNPVVLARLQRAVDRANSAVSRAESIRKFEILDNDFTEANGYLTPSMKIKRPVILKDFAADIDDLYGGPVGEEKTE